MVGVSASHWESLEARSQKLFLLAGVLLVAYATFNGVHAFTGLVYESVENAFGPAGFVLGFLGLLGLYQRLADRSPMLARLGAVCAALGAVGFSVFVVANLGQIAGVLSGPRPAWADVFLVMAAVGMVPGYLSFAVASLRTDGHSRSVGLALLAPPAVFGSMLAGGSMGGSPQWALFLISAGQAMAHLAIGYALRTRLGPTGREVPSGEVAAG